MHPSWTSLSGIFSRWFAIPRTLSTSCIKGGRSVCSSALDISSAHLQAGARARTGCIKAPEI